MLINHILAELAPAARFGSFERAMGKMINGYRHGLHTTHPTCYEYAGAELARLHPANATIRLWGIKASGTIVHGDAVLPDGTVISSERPETYAPRRYELVREIPLAAFTRMMDETA